MHRVDDLFEGVRVGLGQHPVTKVEHMPLGGINRARRTVYQESSDLRGQTNAVQAVALTGREIF